MRAIHLLRRGSPEREPKRGQALVEFALVLPIVLVLVVSVADLGIVFGKLSSLGYASREGARTGAALVRGDGVDLGDCSIVVDPPIDAVVIAAVQRILTSPDSGIAMEDIERIRIFKATASGAVDGTKFNDWIWRNAEVGPDVDPPNNERLEFTRTGPEGWPACTRDNGEVPPDSIGVTVTYMHRFVTPLPALVDAFAGGGLLKLSQTTVMALNPTY